jgi:peptidoglycan/LPS O-acetylase OafA/YrhL
MRALGVTLVLVYHFFPAFLPGGFIGVDIFFVVSGYLITSLLLRETEAKDRVNLPGFLRRRFRRLFPAILTMLLTTLPLSLLISPDFRVDAGRQAAAVLSWTTNWYEILTGQSYEAQLLPHLYIHTWTLSVEMQYYLIWGAVIALIAIIFSKVTFKSGARITVLAAAVLLSVASLITMNVWAAGAADPSAAYLSTPSHFYPLMIGSAFACLCGFTPLPGLVRLAKNRAFLPVALILTCGGIALIIWMSFMYSFDDPRVYSYGLFVLSLITGLILLFAGLLQKVRQDVFQNTKPGGQTVKPEWAVSNYIGLRSYSIYLYHWPVMIIFQQIASELARGAAQKSAVFIATLIAIPVTFIAAELSYRFIEQRFRVSKTAKPPSPVAQLTVQRHRNNKRTQAVIVCVLALALGGMSADAILTAPRISGIEADLKYGAMKLDVRQLKNIHKWLEETGQAASVGRPPGADVPGEGGSQDE